MLSHSLRDLEAERFGAAIDLESAALDHKGDPLLATRHRGRAGSPHGINL